MSDEIEVRTAYCQECGEDFTLGYDEEHNTMYVVCECGVSEEIGDFLERFTDSYSSDDEDVRGFQ